jgi:hypothetical protein
VVVQVLAAHIRAPWPRRLPAAYVAPRVLDLEPVGLFRIVAANHTARPRSFEILATNSEEFPGGCDLDFDMSYA